jgi:hypothetical protein
MASIAMPLRNSPPDDLLAATKPAPDLLTGALHAPPDVQHCPQRGSPSAAVTVAELRALVQDPTQLGQLPVFMTQLGAAVKQQRPRYPLYALFRHCVVPREVHQYAWGTTKKRGRRTLEQLKQWLVSVGDAQVLGERGVCCDASCHASCQQSSRMLNRDVHVCTRLLYVNLLLRYFVLAVHLMSTCTLVVHSTQDLLTC